MPYIAAAMSTHIRTATPQDAAAIQAIAEATWPPTYQDILQPAQLRYMLELFYALPVITRQITTGEQHYLLLTDGDAPVGFAAIAPRAQDPAVYKLHKLYCLPATQGRGYGRLLLHAAEQAARTAQAHTMDLNVNRHNKAQHFYAKQGYAIAYEEDVDIGHGHYMNDYVMRKPLTQL